MGRRGQRLGLARGEELKDGTDKIFGLSVPNGFGGKPPSKRRGLRKEGSPLTHGYAEDFRVLGGRLGPQDQELQAPSLASHMLEESTVFISP